MFKGLLSFKLFKAAVVGILLVGLAGVASNAFAFFADPGVRGGSPGAGGPLPGLTSEETTFFNNALDVFSEVDDVPAGLGPRFNMDGCAGCHAQPAVGGTSPSVNPQIAVATKNGATNTIPSFISSSGPIREARFKSDGSVHELFTIAGRTDAAGCALTQPDFATELANGNVVFRIPTPTFGAGLVEMISDDAIRANRDSVNNNNSFGISGKVNRNGNDGTITRFGWKAQNKSLMLFAAEAYNVEQGVTNDLFQNEINTKDGCVFNHVPESPTNFADGTPTGTLSDIEDFAIFMRFLAPPTPSPDSPGGSSSISAGRNVFSAIGCALCHTPSFSTVGTTTAALNQQPVNLFSDLLLHNMGPGLADGITQGLAGGDEFRTAPLWGLGQRIFFLHDGRTTNLVTAIRAHKSAANSQFQASEANGVVDNFNSLSDFSKQNLLNFLRSL